MDKMNKRNVLFWIFFIILLFVMSYVYRLFIYEIVYTFVMSTWVDIVASLFYFMAIIPLAAYISGKVATFSFEKGLEKRKNFMVFLAVIIIMPTIAFTVIIYMDYKEKNLNDVISFQTDKVDNIMINDDV